MEDRFSEQLVKKYPSNSETLKKTLIIVAAVIISIISLFLTFTIFPAFAVLIVGAIFGAYYLISQMYTEYEYTFTNGTLDIDKIIAKKDRVEMVSVEVKYFTDFQAVKEDSNLNDDEYIRYHLSDGLLNHLCYADFETENDKSRIYFSPSNETLENIEYYAKPEIKEKIKEILNLRKNNDSKENAENS